MLACIYQSIKDQKYCYCCNKLIGGLRYCVIKHKNTLLLSFERTKLFKNQSEVLSMSLDLTAQLGYRSQNKREVYLK